MAITLTTIANLLKTYYLPIYQTILNKQVQFLSRMQKAPKAIFNAESATFAVKPALIRGASFIPRGGTPPTADTLHARQIDIAAKYLVGTLELDEWVIQFTQSNAASFANALKESVIDLKETFRQIANRVYYGDGRGVIFQLTAADDVTDAAITNIDTHIKNHAKWGQKLEIIDVGDYFTALSTAGLTVDEATSATSVDVTGTIAGSADNDYAVLYGSCSNTAKLNYEFIGIDGIVDSSNPAIANYGLDRTAYYYWKGQELANAGVLREFDEELAMQAIEVVELAGGNVTSFWMPHAIARRYFINAVPPDRQYAQGPNVQSFMGGYVRQGVNGLPFIVDKDAPYEKVFALDESTFMVGEPFPIKFIDRDGSVWHRLTTKAATWTSELHWWLTLLCKSPSWNCKIVDVKQGIA